MTERAAPSDEANVELSECDREPIRIPGTVQSQGVLFALDPASTVVKAVSASVETHLGRRVDEALGRAIGDVAPPLHAPAAAQPADGEARPTPFRVTIDVHGSPCDFAGLVHNNGAYTILELEPVPPASTSLLWHSSTPVLFETRQTFALMCGARSVADLCDLVAAELRRLTSYDRTMVYRFLEDGSGEVISEYRSEQLEPYLGQRYPASDIPLQARQLYLAQSMRYISDVDAAASPLVPREMPGTGLPLDLSGAFLRSPSPVHLEYLRNMGVRSSVVMSLVKEGELWGMLVAHNSVAQPCPLLTRIRCDFLGILASSLLAGVTEVEALRAREASRDAVATLVARLVRGRDVTEALAGGSVTLLDAVAADGFAVCGPDGTIRTFGESPSANQVGLIVREIEGRYGRAIAASENIVRDWPALGSIDAEPACGVLFAPALEGGNSFVAWFRNEEKASIAWAGDPSKATVTDPAGRLRPRNSFALWREEVRGRAKPWTEADRNAAGIIREHLTAAELVLAQAELARLASQDALTGLANRRVVDSELDRLAHEEADCAAIYIDLDRFKAVNDNLGHEAGDELLVGVAERLTSLVRPGDIVARFGGDEFVVICNNCPSSAAATLAERIVQGFEAPFRLGDATVSETVSVGWATAKSIGEATELIRRADKAMYYAKQHGGNQAAYLRGTRVLEMRIEGDPG